MKAVEKTDKIRRLLEDLQDAMDKGIPVVVEGPGDAKALVGLGLDGKVVTLSKKPVADIVQHLSQETKEVIILTDFDTYGVTAAKKLREFFTNECVQVNLSFRTRFKKLLDFVEFEDVPTLVENEIQ